MASYTAIADVSETLRAMVRDRLAARDDVFSMDGEGVSLVSPDEGRAAYVMHVLVRLWMPIDMVTQMLKTN